MLRAAIRLYGAKVLETEHKWDHFANLFIIILLGAGLLVMCLAILFQLGAIRRLRLAECLVAGLAFLSGLLIVGSAAIVAVASGLSWSDRMNASVLFALRDIHLDSGVSPILPALLLGVGLLIMGILGLRWEDLRVRLAGSPALSGTAVQKSLPSGKRLKTLIDQSAGDFELLRLNSSSLPTWTFLMAGMALSVLAILEIWHRMIPTLEHWVYDLGFAVAFGVILILLVLLLLRFVDLWWTLSRMLEVLAELPLAAALERLPDRARVLFGRLFQADARLDRGWDMFERTCRPPEHLPGTPDQAA